MRERPKPISLVVWPGVPADVAAAVGRAVALYPGVSAVRHRIAVEVAPAPAISVGGGVGFGVCGIPDAPPDGWRGVVKIALAGLFADECESQGCSRPEAVAELVRVLAHELSHYEQWRDGRAITERVANRRMARLADRLLAPAA